MRFCADSGLLRPAQVDPVSGHRYYGAYQVTRAAVPRRLREIGMPLTAVEAALDAEPDDAARLIDEHVAKVCEDPASALAWDIRPPDAADAGTEQRVQQHHDGLHLAGCYPSLHLNLADDYRRLGSFDAATEHIAAAGEHLPALSPDVYGSVLRTALGEVAEAIRRRDTPRRASAPGPAA